MYSNLYVFQWNICSSLLLYFVCVFQLHHPIMFLCLHHGIGFWRKWPNRFWSPPKNLKPFKTLSPQLITWWPRPTFYVRGVLHPMATIYCTSSLCFPLYTIDCLVFSNYCSAASAPCSTSTSYIPADLCACYWIPCLCTGKRITWFKKLVLKVIKCIYLPVVFNFTFFIFVVMFSSFHNSCQLNNLYVWFLQIMIGILFFLFEFYDDQLLAFMVLILVWLCELFTLIRWVSGWVEGGTQRQFSMHHVFD